MGILKGCEKDKWQKKIYDEIMTKHLSDLLENINQHSQKAQETGRDLHISIS